MDIMKLFQFIGEKKPEVFEKDPNHKVIEKDGHYKFDGDIGWRDGKSLKQGDWSDYNGDGSLNVKKNYVDGELDGDYVNYFKNGYVYQHIIYEMGNLMDEKTYFNNGDIKSHVIRTKGDVGTMTIYRATNGGIVQEKGDVMLREDNSQRYYRIGTWKFYDFDGKLVQELNYD